MNWLFVCTENRLRSATAEAVFNARPGIEAIGAGTNRDAPTPLSGDLIEWADRVFAMEPAHRRRITARFGDLLRDTPVVVLGIPDNYDYMDPDLVALLEARTQRYQP